MPKQEHDAVNQPKHYTTTECGIEPIHVIEAFNLRGHFSSVIRYVLRHDGDRMDSTNIRKAIWYLARYIKVYYGEELGPIDVDKPFDEQMGIGYD